MTDEYRKILTAIAASPYHVTDPSRACVFVPGFDTLCLFNSWSVVSFESSLEGKYHNASLFFI